MRRLGSLVMRVADRVRVPAGAALAVDREQFAARVTAAIHAHPLITRRARRSRPRFPRPRDAVPVIIATGPLTRRRCRPTSPRSSAASTSRSSTPSVPSCWPRSIDTTKVFRASRWDRSLRPRADAVTGRGRGVRRRRRGRLPELSVHAGRIPRVSRGHRVGREGRRCTTSTTTKFFEGCLPIEVMAHRGRRHAAVRADEAGRA